MAVKPVPEGYPTVIPYLVVEDVARVIEFARQAFGAKETHRMTLPDGTIMHAQITIGHSPVMLGQAGGRWKPMPAVIYIYVDNADAVYRRTLELGATSLMEPADQFHGDRNAGVEDPCGNYWWIATHIEDLSPEEIEASEQAFIDKAFGAQP